MASLWNMLREEVRGTVDDFRQKGALGALRDAALDTKDLALDAGGWLVSGVKDLVNVNEDGEGIAEAYVVGPDVPKRGSTCMLCLPDGNLVEATAVDVDGVSEPPRARVVIPGVDQPMLVPVLEPGGAREAMNIQAEKSSGGDAGLDLFTGLKEEINSTVEEFRQKGAVGALRDAALDAVDLVGSTANSAVSGARSLAEPAVQDFREKGAVGAVKDAALDAVDILGSTAKSAVSGAKSMASPLIDLVSDQPEEGEADGRAPASAEREAGASGSSSAPPAGDGSQQRGSLLDELKQEWQETVNDFREKGAVGAVKDAALDAVDLVGSTATTAFDAASTVVMGARARAAPLLSGGLPDLWADNGNEGASVPEAAEAASAASASSGARAAAPSAESAKAKPPSPSKPVAFAPPARSAASSAAPAQTPKSPEARTSAAAPPSPSNAAEQVKEPVPESEMPNGKTGRPSLVSMRRGMFEKPKAQEDSKKDSEEAQSAAKEAEELID